MPQVKIINPKGTGWLGTKYFIDGKKVNNVRSVDFHVAVGENPTSIFELTAIPDIDIESQVCFSFTAPSVEDAVRVLRHELLMHGEIYNGFKASLKSALEKYNCCGLPFEPEEEIAGKMLDFLIGEDK